MAKSKYEYVRLFERDPTVLRDCWPVLRLDGRAFMRFTETHGYEKPNDFQGLNLMNASAIAVMREFKEIILAYGQSDEFSFVLRKDAELYGRRSFKLVSLVTSVFTGSFVRLWTEYFPNKALQYSPSFDGRIIEYPSVRHVRDYLSWRQVDAHINNQYNTCFWALVKSGMSKPDAQQFLQGTNKEAKNELLFKKFGINYNNELDMFRKGSVILWEVNKDANDSNRLKHIPTIYHIDLIRDDIWTYHDSLTDLK